MLRATIEQAREGMVLAMPIHHPRTATRLLAEGFRLDRKTISRLRELGVLEVWIDYPNTEQIRQYLSPRVLAKQCRVLSALADMFHSLHRNVFANLDFLDYRRGITDLLGTLTQEPTAANYVAEMAGRPANDFRHGSAVSILSLLLGIKLQDYLIHERSRLNPRYARSVVNLALGGMLHDVGLLRFDPHIRRRLRQEFDEADPDWRRHPHLGYQMLSGRIDATAVAVVLQHHQYYDGTGYPAIANERGEGRILSGHDIHIFARICCVADHYDRLRHPYGERERLRVEALRMMIEPPLVDRFDPVVLQTLFDVVPAYAPGSIVRLNTGDRAIVVGWDPDHPCRPPVQVVDEDAMEPDALVRTAVDASYVEPIYHDLRRCTDLWIAEQDGIEVSRWNFTLPGRREITRAA